MFVGVLEAGPRGVPVVEVPGVSGVPIGIIPPGWDGDMWPNPKLSIQFIVLETSDFAKVALGLNLLTWVYETLA